MASQIRELVTVRLPIAVYVLVGLGLLIQGVRYLSADAVMAYHSAVINTPWDNLSAEYQRLFLGLLKGFGAGSFGVGLATVLMALLPLRNGNRWARWATPTVAGGYCAALVYVTNFALLPNAVPIVVSFILLGLVAMAAAVSFFGPPGNSSVGPDRTLQ